MKCECPNCQGTGEVRCLQCNGEGYVQTSVENFKFDKRSDLYDELTTLQKDAKRIRRQTEELIRLNPKYSGRYTDYMLAGIREIESQAAKLQETQNNPVPHFFA